MSGKKHGLENSYKKLRMGGMFYSKGGGADMSPKQKAIAAKAPPPNVLDGKDFAVLRAEKKPVKAFMGLAVEAMKKSKKKGAKGIELVSPVAMAKRLFNKKDGGVIKANTGKDIKFPKASGGKSSKKFLDYIKRLEDKPIRELTEFEKRRLKLKAGD
jgi:hypothetical protein|tara:strand:+ start:666 stop:1136 length:471 start_codon:yes stop_codon:yes gene_type:complete